MLNQQWSNKQKELLDKYGNSKLTKEYIEATLKEIWDKEPRSERKVIGHMYTPYGWVSTDDIFNHTLPPEIMNCPQVQNVLNIVNETIKKQLNEQ
jgi:hypothetical protein